MDKGECIMDMNKYYKQLEGFSINKYLGEGEDGFPKFLLKAPNHEPLTIEVSADEEGNYGGFLFIGKEDDS